VNKRAHAVAKRPSPESAIFVRKAGSKS
jgi:hypothetical protein